MKRCSIKQRNVVLVVVLAVSMLVAACATVPITGRKQLSLIPRGEIRAMSFQQYDKFLSENKRSTDKQANAAVERVGHRIQGAVERYFTEKDMASHLEGYEWEFNVIESEDVNAWCMPGGKVVFYTGILPICQDDVGIAVVMGHEVAHAVAEHGSERMSHGLLTQLGGAALSEALKNKPEQTQSLWMTAFGVGAQYGALLPYSRKQESEADHLGLIFMAMAGYDPQAAPLFWERMSSSKEGVAPPEFMSTHPSDKTRIRQLKAHLPEALRYYKP